MILLKSLWGFDSLMPHQRYVHVTRMVRERIANPYYAGSIPVMHSKIVVDFNSCLMYNKLC